MDAMKMMWAAGLLEGEGCFSIHQSKRTRKSGAIWVGPKHPVMACGMTDEDVVRRLHDILGAGTVFGPYNRGPQYKPVWTWKVQGRRASDLMLIYLHLMGERRQARILEILEECGVFGVWAEEDAQREAEFLERYAHLAA